MGPVLAYRLGKRCRHQLGAGFGIGAGGLFSFGCLHFFYQPLGGDGLFKPIRESVTPAAWEDNDRISEDTYQV